MTRYKTVDKLKVGDRLPWFRLELEGAVSGEVRRISREGGGEYAFRVTIFDPEERRERDLFYNEGDSLLVA